MDDFVDMSSDNEPKRKSKLGVLIASGATILVCAGLILGAVFISGIGGEEVENTLIAPDNDPAYEAAKESYAARGIEYTYDDYAKDKQAAEALNTDSDYVPVSEDNLEWAGVNSNAYMHYDSKRIWQNSSSAKQQYLDQLQEEINEITGWTSPTVSENPDGGTEGSNSGDSGSEGDSGSSEEENPAVEEPPLDVAGIMNTIVEWTWGKNAFIATRFGWPADTYDDPFYEEIAANTLAVLNSIASGDASAVDTDIFSYDEMVQAVRSSVWHESPYTVTSYDDSVKQRADGWYRAGHPVISEIVDISVDKTDETFDEEPAALVARITDGNGTLYNAYLQVIEDQDGNLGYAILDVVKM